MSNTTAPFIYERNMQYTPTTSNQREQEILRELRLAGGLSRISFLADRLGVSDETIRRNIKSLARPQLEPPSNEGGRDGDFLAVRAAVRIR